MTRAAIRINFQRAKNQASTLEQIAEDLSRLSCNDFAGTMQLISTNWKGNNANAYLQKGFRLQDDMNDTVQQLREVASEIRRIAQRIYDAEMAALRIAEQRNY